eukprot:PhF_6_TR29211/c0_g1_i1/m.42738/K05309/PTGES2; microsomal prostaglandin-E synthase 2
MFRKSMKVMGVGAVLGVGGMGYVYQMRLKQNSSVSAEDFNGRQDQNALKAQIEKLMSPKGGADPVVLYRYSTCPFCGKVKAFLDLHKIPHDCVEVEPIFKSEIQTHGYFKVPQLRFNAKMLGPFLVDSDRIVDVLSEALPDPNWKKQLKDPKVQQWREFARERLVRYIVININTSLMESWRGYSYIDQHDTIAPHNKVFLKVLGAPVMYLVSQYKTLPTLKEKDGYDATKVPPAEALRGVLREWEKEGLGMKKFNGGDKPNVADVEVYGVLQSIRGHRVYSDIVRGSVTMKKWLDNMDSLMPPQPSTYKQ